MIPKFSELTRLFNNMHATDDVDAFRSTGSPDLEELEKLAKQLVNAIETDLSAKRTDNTPVHSSEEIYDEFRKRFFQTEGTSEALDTLRSPKKRSLAALSPSYGCPTAEGEKRFREDAHSKTPLISRFHTGAREIEGDIVKNEFHELVRTSFSERLVEGNVPKRDEIVKLRSLVADYCTSFDQQGRPLLCYDEYERLVEDAALPARVSHWMNASLYAKLLHGEKYGRILASNLVEYVARKAWVWQTRTTLCVYDAVGMGYLREEDLESYVNDFISSADLDLSREMKIGFSAYYTCYITRQTMFLLDAAGTGSICIRDLFASGLINHLLALSSSDNSLPPISSKETGARAQKIDSPGSGGADDSLFNYSLPSPDGKNWFALSKVEEVYNSFIDLDRDADGLLSHVEFARFDDGKFTKTFVDRVYEVSNTYHGCLDFRAFLDVYFAIKDRNNPASIRFMFRILDIKHNGRVDLSCFHHFYRGLSQKLTDYVSLATDWDFNKIMTSISAMLNIKDWSGELTVKDFLQPRSHFGGTVFGMLTDLDAFFSYENRYEPDSNSSST